MWIAAIKKEIENFWKRNVWEMTSRKQMLEEGRKAIKTKHVFKIKNKAYWSTRYKDSILVSTHSESCIVAGLKYSKRVHLKNDR